MEGTFPWPLPFSLWTLSPPASRCSQGELQALRGRRGQSRPLCLGTEGAAPQAPPSLCTGGVQKPQGGPPLSGGSLRNDEAANPAPQSEVLSARSPWCVCLSCCQLDTWFRNADEGGKQTEFSAHSGPAAHSPLQKDAPPTPQLASRRGALCVSHVLPGGH